MEGAEGSRHEEEEEKEDDEEEEEEERGAVLSEVEERLAVEAVEDSRLGARSILFRCDFVLM